MKKALLGLLLIATLIIIISTPSFADANDFSFKSFTGDYYLLKNDSGNADVEIKESFVASFPDIDQNHGINRYLQKNDEYLGYLDEASIKVNQNELPVTYTLINEDEKLCIHIGEADEYVHGEVKYDISYTYRDISIDQWFAFNTNGEWAQPFESVVAKLHLSQELFSSLESDSETDTALECYVGLYNSANQSQCNITFDDDEVEDYDDRVITFSSQNLISKENLSVYVKFKEGAFSNTQEKTETTEPEEETKSKIIEGTAPTTEDPLAESHNNTLIFVIVGVILLGTIATVVIILAKKSTSKASSLPIQGQNLSQNDTTNTAPPAEPTDNTTPKSNF